MFVVDLHTHTRFFHGRRALGDRYDPIGYRLLAAAAGRRGLDGIATTNHDYRTAFETPAIGDRIPGVDRIPGTGRLPGVDRIPGTDRIPGVDRVTTIPGIEISTTRGHVLVVGPDPPAETTPGSLTPAEAVGIAHDRGCAAIVAHPYRNSTVREADHVPFDAIEVNGKHPRTRPLVERLAAERDLPLVGGSDAHYPIEVGRAVTAIDAETLSAESVVAAIRDGRVEARIDSRPVDAAVQRLYRAIHGRKGQFEGLDVPTPGVGAPPGEGDD